MGDQRASACRLLASSELEQSPCNKDTYSAASEVSAGPEFWLQCAQYPLKD